jgi:hypothetical protein
LVALPVVLLFLLLGQGQLIAQQSGQGWSQTDPYNGQYAPNQQSAYWQAGNGQSGYTQQPNMDSGQAYPQNDYGPAQQPAQSLNAEQLEQLVAPIALYPDSLVAQILAASTYPAQVVGADQWRQSLVNATPDLIAAEADMQNWDPSVKALTAFPQVLALMDQNLQWTTDLGNAYYNQPQDVLQTVQVLRQRAQEAGSLENTSQEAVNYDQGNIELAPVNPQMVYVPAYDPWNVYGRPISPYSGFSLLGSLASLAGSSPVTYGLGLAMSAFGHMSWGWMGWGLNWLSQAVLFHHANYYSQSTSVAHWSTWHGRLASGSAISRQTNNWNRTPGNYGRAVNGYNRIPDPGFARPAMQAYNHTRPPISRTQPYASRSQEAVRPGYGSDFASRPEESNRGRLGAIYSSPMQQSFRAPAASSQRGYFGERFSAPDAGRDYARLSDQPKRSGGFHLFGGGHASEKAYGGYSSKNFSGGQKVKRGNWGGGGHSGGHSRGSRHH